MEHEHYIKSLALMQATIDAGYQGCNPAWDELYGYMHSVFPEPETAYVWSETRLGYEKLTGDRYKMILEHFETEDMVLMFQQSHEDIIAKISSIPPVILAVTFPVWVARYLLKFQRVAANPHQLKTFDEFHRRYGPMIFLGSDRSHHIDRQSK